MQRRKLLLCTLLAARLAVQLSDYGWLIVHRESLDTRVVVLEMAHLLYFLCLGILGVRQVERHIELVWHLTALTTLATSLMLVAMILPDPQTAAGSSAPLWFWRVEFLFNVALTLVAMNTPLGPPLHYPSSAIYSQETASSSTNTDKENVTGVVG
jgi:hypothetical protein